MPKEIRLCPVCDRITSLSIEIVDNDKKENGWYICRCGCISSKNGKIDKSVFDEEYKKKYEDGKGLKERLDYTRSVYLPMIQELTMGRKYFEIGFGSDYNIVKLNEEGWFASGIDIIKNDYNSMDFEKFQTTQKFDVIWASHVLESLDNPVEALKKCYSMLNPNGVIYISTPCTDIIYEGGIYQWGGWNTKEGHVYFSKRTIEDTLRACGFEVVLSTEIYQQRFTQWNTIHVIAQKMCAGKIGGSNGEVNKPSDSK